jgi:hypothetical protein
MPSVPGISRSRTTTLYEPVSASRRPSSPLVAVSISKPSLRKARARRRSTRGSSSIARTRSLICVPGLI